MKKKLITILLTLICILLMTGCGTKTVDIQKYIQLEYSSNYNGYATPELVIDEDGLNSKVDDKKMEDFFIKLVTKMSGVKPTKQEIAELKSESETLPKLKDFLTFDFANDYRRLSNGDEVIVNVYISEQITEGLEMSTEEILKELGIKLSKNEVKFKVKGLEKFKSVTLELDKILELDFGKYNGYGTPTVDIDTEYLKKTAIPEIVKEYAYEFSGYTRSLIENDYEWFDVEFDKAYSNISNGDEVKVQIVLSEDLVDAGISLAELEQGLGITLSDTIKTYKVSGLEEPKNVIDVFEGIENYIKYEGGNGHGRIYSIEIPKDYSRVVDDLYFSRGHSIYADSLKVIYNNTRIADINFEFDHNLENLSEGDVVEITFFGDTKELEKLGYIVPTKKKSITVPNLGIYLTSKDQITPEVVEAIKTEIIEKRSPNTINEIYIATYNPGAECNHKFTTFIVPVVYKKKFFERGYYIDQVYDVIIKPDGSIETDYNDGWRNYDTLEEAKATFDTTRYSFELIYEMEPVAE